jgi:hypothetical protein
MRGCAAWRASLQLPFALSRLNPAGQFWSNRRPKSYGYRGWHSPAQRDSLIAADTPSELRNNIARIKVNFSPILHFSGSLFGSRLDNAIREIQCCGGRVHDGGI